MYYTWVIQNLNLHAISWAWWLLIDSRISPSFSPCWITSFFSFCESLREPHCVCSRHPNPQVCLPYVPFLVCSPSFSSYLHPQALHAVAQFPTILQRLSARCLYIACLFDIDTCFLYLTPTAWFSALFYTSYFGRSRYTYFFRRKVSASRIVSSTSALLPELFQKLFRVSSSMFSFLTTF